MMISEIHAIYDAISAEGFADRTLRLISEHVNDILYGRKDFDGFTLPEHAGLCTAGATLIGAVIVVGYARRSLGSSGDVAGSQGAGPANWQIDEEQERLLEAWALVGSGC